MDARTLTHSVVFFALAIVALCTQSLFVGNYPLVCLCLVMTVGVSHGALDYVKGRAVLKTFERSQIRTFYFAYVAFACLIIAAWRLSPVALLTIFLLIAAYHFGKEDSEFVPGAQQGLGRLLYLAKGIAVIVAPLAFNPQATEVIFQSLNMTVIEIFSVHVCASLLVLSFVSNLILGARCRRSTLTLLLDFTSILVLNWALHPLVAFCFYFCFLHSIRHSMELMGSMHGRASERLITFIRKTLPLTCVTGVIFALALYGLLINFSLDDSTNKVIFLGLAALTFPHVILEYLFESRVVSSSDLGQSHFGGISSQRV